MKKTFAFLCCLAIGMVGVNSCIEDEYDLDKDIDKSIMLKNFSIAVSETFTFYITDIVTQSYTIGSGGNFTVTLPDGVVGSCYVDRISRELTDKYIYSNATVSATIVNNLPEPFTVTATAYDRSGNPMPAITATCTPALIPTGSSPVKVELKASGNIHNLDAVSLEMTMDKNSVTFNKNQTVVIKDIVIRFPDGVGKKED